MNIKLINPSLKSENTMTTLWDKTRYFIALILIAIALLFSAAIWSTPPSLGYLAIFISSVFALILTLSWIITFFKTNYGKLILVINVSICLVSIGFLMKKSGGFEDYQRNINISGNIIAAIMTVLLGTINFKKIKNKYP